MADSGVPWDYAYAYLAGGVNTGNGWAGWDTAGQYPLFVRFGLIAARLAGGEGDAPVAVTHKNSILSWFPALSQSGARYRWDGEETFGMIERSYPPDKISRS